MVVPGFRHNVSHAPAYSTSQVSAWLGRLRLPVHYRQYIDDPSAIPKTYQSLDILFKGQITVFPYENLSVHYSSTHLVDIKPDVLYRKMMEDPGRGRGGYCMELSIFFHHMLRGLGFRVTMTCVRNRTRTDGVPSGEYQGWTHINNIIHLPDWAKYSADVAFGGDGPTAPLPMSNQATVHDNLGSQQVRLVHDHMDKQQQRGEPQRLWIYQYRNGPGQDWRSFYSFPGEVKFFQQDFEVQNWWACAHTLHRWTVLVVRFLREGESVEFAESEGDDDGGDAVGIVGKVMLVNDVVKVNLGGKTQVVCRLGSERERVAALKKYFNISLLQEEVQAIRGWDAELA